MATSPATPPPRPYSASKGPLIEGGGVRKAAAPKKPIANDMDNGDDMSGEENNTNQQVEGELRSKRKQKKKEEGEEIQRTLGLNPKAEKSTLIKTKVEFDYNYTLDGLMSGDSTKCTFPAGSGTSMWQLFSINEETKKVTYIGDPTHAVIRKISVKETWESDTEMPITFSVNHLAGKSIAAINAMTKRTVWNNGKQKLATVYPRTGHVRYGKKHNKHCEVIYENPHEIDPEFFSRYGSYSKEDIMRGITIYKPPGKEEATEENQASWAAHVVLLGEKKNPFMAHLLWKNQHELRKEPFNLEYTQLEAQVKSVKGVYVSLPYKVAVELIQKAERGGIDLITAHMHDLTKTALVLGHPQGGEAGNFSGLNEYLEKMFSPSALEILKTQVFKGRIVLKFVFALPDIATAAQKQQ